MKIIVLGILTNLMHGTIATLNESQPASVEPGPLAALQRISDHLDEISVEKNDHHQKMKNGIVERFQAILQSDNERHEILRSSLQRIIDGDLPTLGKTAMVIINNISKKIENSRENDKENIQILENETNAQVEALNEKRSKQETELKTMLLKIFSTFTPLKSCSQYLEFGFNSSGIYEIKPDGMDFSFPAYCDMDIYGDGWIVIQRRGDFNGEVVNFNRSWNEYKNGFGNLNGEFWLGNEKIHLLTKNKNVMLIISWRYYSSDTIMGRGYSMFNLKSEQESYKLAASPPGSGDPNDPFYGLRGDPFRTYDHNPTCYNGAGWWYLNTCRATIHLNGPRGNVINEHGVTIDGSKPVAFSSMKIRVIE